MGQNPANRIIKNTGYLYMKMVITVFISLLTTRVVLNALGAEDFGIFNIVGGAIAMMMFLNVSMTSATQRFFSYAKGENDENKLLVIFNVSVVIHFVVALIVALILVVAGYFFFNGILNIPHSRHLPSMVIYGSLIISTFFTILTVPYDAAINAHENMKLYAIIGVLEAVLKLIIAYIISFTASLDRLILYGILMSLVPIVSMFVMRIYCKLHYAECKVAIKQYWDKNVAKRMVAFAGWNLLSTSSSMIGNYGHGIILNHFFGTILNAAFGIVQQLNGQLLALTNNLYKAVNPVIGKSAGSHDENIMRTTAMVSAKFGAALFLVLAIPIYVVAPYLLKIWLVNVPIWTLVFLRLQLIRSFIDVVFITLNNMIGAVGHIKEISIFSSCMNLLQLPVIYLLFKINMPPSVLYVVAIVISSIVYICYLYYGRKYADLSIKLYARKVIIPSLLNAMVSYGVVVIISNTIVVDSLGKLILFVGVSIPIFIVIFVMLFCNTEERKVVSGATNKLVDKIIHRK